MEFFLIFGIFLIAMACIIRSKLQWEVDENPCNLENEIKVVKTNRRAWWGLIIGGSVMVIGSLLFMFFS